MLNERRTLAVHFRAVIQFALGIVLVVSLIGCWSPEFLSPTPTASETPESTQTEAAVSCTWEASLIDDSPNQAMTAWPVQILQTVWTLNNEGTCDWTAVTLVLISPTEPEMLGGYPVPHTDAQSSVELAFEWIAPATLGAHSREWRLRAPDGTLFGPTLRTDLVVQPYPAATPQSPYGVLSQAGCILDSAFVQDVTLTDGAVVQPGAALQKTWQVQNIGTCDWQAGSSLIFISGNSMGVTDAVMIPPTRSGQTANIQLNLIAPTQPGDYTSWWRLQSADGALFGILLYIQIRVVPLAAATTSGPNAAGTSEPIGTPTPTTTPTSSATPYTQFIHNINYHSRQIFLDGRAKGNRADVFTKVGDSITDVPAFLNPIGDGFYILHEYAYLQPAIHYFSQAAVRGGNSFNSKSLAAVWGWSSFDVLNPDRAAETCAGLIPLACEYREVKPAVAIILIGTNDAMSGTDRSVYEGNLRRIVEISIEHGVIPVLSTMPYNQFAEVQPYNQIIMTTAIALDIPWMDFYGATWNLANHGISWEDGVHPSIPDTNDPTDFSADNLHYGHTVRNLLVLHVLDALWRQVLAY